MNVGDYVRFTGHGNWRSNKYGYPIIFGEGEHKVVSVKESCCNRFLILERIDGMYNEDFFTEVEVSKP